MRIRYEKLDPGNADPDKGPVVGLIAPKQSAAPGESRSELIRLNWVELADLNFDLSLTDLEPLKLAGLLDGPTMPPPRTKFAQLNTGFAPY